MMVVIDILKGAASILLVVLPLLIPQVQEFLIKRYQLSLDKALEDKKSKNERKNYVSKVRFDKEFEVYQKLMPVCFQMLYSTKTLVTTISLSSKMQHGEYKNTVRKDFEKYSVSINKFRDVLYDNGAFISVDIYKGFHDIVIDAHEYREPTFEYAKEIQNSRTASLNVDGDEVLTELTIKIENIVVQVREYLQSLEVID